jgi:outer membrane protein assembly factor BamE (lipoprotein component of BamABCDE complex)
MLDYRFFFTQMNQTKNILIFLSLSIFLVSCVSAPQPLSDRNSQLTQGNVQLNLKVGITSKAEVLDKFGSPNITTRDGSGKEVWTYQRQAQVAQSSAASGGWSILLIGQSTNAAGFESSSRMITLIIKFDASDVVSDFRSRASNF